MTGVRLSPWLQPTTLRSRRVARHPHRPPSHRISAIIRYRPGALGRLWYMALFQSRFLPERLLKDPEGHFGSTPLEGLVTLVVLPEAEMREVIRAMRQPGVGRAALSYYRQLPDCLSQAGRRSGRFCVRGPAPTLALALRMDASTPRSTRSGCVKKTSLAAIGGLRRRRPFPPPRGARAL